MKDQPEGGEQRTQTLAEPGRSRKSASDTRPSESEGRGGVEPPQPLQVGRYVLLKQLGSGGMGVVYAAYDPDLDRKVALKLLRADSQTDPDLARARLLREAQAMARVSHPHVIPVFDVGMWSAQVFLTMELVDGGTLRDWLAQGARSWREVLAKFLDAGRGLEAAHHAGLVHRDFKPANVLVSRAGRVYVMDFGLARQVDDTGPVGGPDDQTQELSTRERRMLETTLTVTGTVMGTPSYMSPEQLVGGELDARSDQFSFCTALYSALYGRRPFEPEQLRRLARARARDALGSALPVPLVQEPPREAKVPAWVRQAVLRGLALEPAERFPTMHALLEALSQEQRLARRRRGAVAAGVVGVGLLAVGGTVYQQSQVCQGSGQQMAQVWGPAARGRLQQAFLATGSPLAQETVDRAAQVLEQYASAWTQQHTEACEATRVREVQPEELLVRRVVCLERRRRDVGAVVELLASADKKGVEKAMDAVHALPSLQECEDVAALAEQQPLPADPAKRSEIDRLGGQLAELKALVDTGRAPVALERAVQLEAPVLATGYLPLMAELRMQLGWVQDQLGKPAEASRALRLATYDAEAGRVDRLKVTILNRLLYVEEGRKRFEEAEGWGELAEATLKRMGGEPVLRSDVLVNRSNLAVAQGQLPRALELLEQAQGLLSERLAPEHPKRARITFLQGRVLMNLGRPERAVVLLREALRQTEAAVGKVHPDMARRHLLLSWALRELGQYEPALEHSRATMEIRKALLGPSNLPVAQALDEMGMCLLKLGRHEEALRVYQQALETKRAVLEPGNEELQYSYDGVGQALLGLGRAREALEPLRQALTFTTVSAQVLADSGFALARALWDAGQPVEARAQAAKAHERFTQARQEARAAEVFAWMKAHPAPR